VRGVFISILCDVAALTRRGLEIVCAVTALAAFGSLPTFGLDAEKQPQVSEPFTFGLDVRHLPLAEPFAITVEAKHLSLPEPFTITVQMKRQTLPEPFSVTVQAKRLPLPDPFSVTIVAKPLPVPDPFNVAVQIKRLPLPEPFSVSVYTKRIPVPEPFRLTIEAKRPPLPEPFTLSVEAKRQPLPDPFTLTVQAKRISCDGPQKAYEQAKGHYDAGQFSTAVVSYGNAQTLLAGIGGASACPDLAKQIAAGRDKAEKTRDAVAKADAALSACDARPMSAALRELKPFPDPHPVLARKIAQLEQAAPKIAKFSATLEKGNELYEQGHLAKAKTVLQTLQAEIDALDGKPACPDLSRKVVDTLDKISTLIGDLNEADAAIKRCDITEIDNLLRRFHAKPYHKMIRAKIPELKRAKNRCILQRAEDDAKACNIQAMRNWMDTSLTDDEATVRRIRAIMKRALPHCIADVAAKGCVASFGEFSRATEIKDEKTFKCNCIKGYEWNGADNRCVSHDQVMTDGFPACHEKFGNQSYPVKHKGHGVYECQCYDGFMWNSDRTSCIPQPTKADGAKACVDYFGPGAFPIRPYPTGQWECGCGGNYVMNAARNHCVPLTAADGNAACKRQFGPNSYATGYRGNGSWNCATPRPQIIVPNIQIPIYPRGGGVPRSNCHPYRDGRPGLDCSGH
jgi:hypothetical protein